MTRKLTKAAVLHCQPDLQPISQTDMLLPKEWETCQKMAETDPSDHSNLNETLSVSLPTRTETDREHKTTLSWESMCLSREELVDTYD